MRGGTRMKMDAEIASVVFNVVTAMKLKLMLYAKTPPNSYRTF